MSSNIESLPKFHDPEIEERAYAVAFEELATCKTRPGLWAKALADADGDKAKAEARYLKLRVKAELAMIAEQVGTLGQHLANAPPVNASDALSMSHRSAANGSTASRFQSEKQQFDFMESIASCMSRAFQLTGRTTRSEYWWFAGSLIFLSIFAGALFWPIGPLLIALVFGIPAISSTCRRLRDSGVSPWWFLLGCLHIPGQLVLWYLCAKPSDAKQINDDEITWGQVFSVIVSVLVISIGLLALRRS